MAIMKKYLVIVSLSLAATTTFAQGLVNFANTPSTLVSVEPLVYPPQPYTLMSGPAGSVYFGLFFGEGNPYSWTFTGIYATNTGVSGLFSGGVVAVPGWAPGTSQSYFVAGWDAGMGHNFNPQWLMGANILADFGTTPVLGTGIAGDGASIPTLNLFDGGGSTITVGMQLHNELVPEPSTAVLAIMGAAAVRHFRLCRKRKSRGLLCPCSRTVLHSMPGARGVFMSDSSGPARVGTTVGLANWVFGAKILI
jgi:hypothetical protein